jgi:hypothetical protein
MALPGGELSIGEQDEIISMLENLRDQKRLHLELLDTADTHFLPHL